VRVCVCVCRTLIIRNISGSDRLHGKFNLERVVIVALDLGHQQQVVEEVEIAILVLDSCSRTFAQEGTVGTDKILCMGERVCAAPFVQW